MPKKMTRKSQGENKTPLSQYPFLTLKRYHVNNYANLSFNCIMRIYSNLYNYAIYLKLFVFLSALSIQ